jgi:hypothetical protein
MTFVAVANADKREARRSQTGVPGIEARLSDFFSGCLLNAASFNSREHSPFRIRRGVSGLREWLVSATANLVANTRNGTLAIYGPFPKY